MWEPFSGHGVTSGLSQTAGLSGCQVFFSSSSHLLLIFKCKKTLNQSGSNITHTCAHTHLGVQADLVAHRLVFRSGFVSRNSASVQSVNAISHVCLLPACCFHCLLFFFPSFPPPLCLLLRVPCWGFFFLFFFGER